MKIGVSATLAANEALDKRRRQGLPVLPMAFGQAGLPVHAALRRELAAATHRNGYGPVAGAPELLEAAADYWNRRGLPTTSDMVVCGPGSKPLLFALLTAIGADVAIAAPSWVSYAVQARIIGRQPLLVPTLPGQGGVPNPGLLASAIDRARAAGRDVRSVIVTLPDNPTGTLPRPETIRRLCEVAESRDLIIISDEIYRDLVFDPDAAFISPADIAPERTVITTGLAKNLALGGWRIGVARLPDSPVGRELHGQLLGLASEIWSSSPVPIQHAAAYAFSEPPEIVERIASSRRLHGIMARAVAERFVAAGAMVTPPQGAFYIYPDLERWRDRLEREHGITTGPECSQFLLNRYGLGVLPGSAFGDSAEALRFRVATSLLYGENDEQREAALAADNPLALPWVAASLERLEEVLTKASSGKPDRLAREVVVAR